MKYITATDKMINRAKLATVKMVLESIGYKVKWNGCNHKTGIQLAIGNKG